MAERQFPVLEELLPKAQAGDRTAQNELFDICRAYVRFMARTQVESWIQGKVDASDLVQQTLLEAHRGLDRFDGATEAELLGWLKQILKNNAKDFVRRFGAAKRQASREVNFAMGQSSMTGGAPEPEGREETPSKILVRREEELLVANALEHLSEDHQEVIVLRNLQRLPFEEVAERMGRSRPAVQMLWMRAMKKLQEEIARMSGVQLPSD